MFNSSIGCYIVEIEQRYNNIKNVGGIDLIMNLDVDNATYVNRLATLTALPKDYEGEMEVGMRVIIHHNIARTTMGFNDQKVNDFHISENYYRCPFNLLFLYEKDGEWKANGAYCFVKPIENEKVEKIGSIYIPDSAQEKNKALHGIMQIPNKQLDVLQGEEVIYKPNSEHEYELDGVKVYKMHIDRVLLRGRRADEAIPENADEHSFLNNYVLL